MENPLDLPAFRDYVARRCGLTLNGMAEAHLADVIDARAKSTASATRAKYLARLMADDAEFSELIVLLTNKETYFFREPRQLSFAVEALLPRMLAEPGVRLPLRILSAGCSSGEEPYSIAIALVERFGVDAARLCSVTGCDIDHRALEKARRAEYAPFAFRAIDPALKSRHFTPATGSGKGRHVLNAPARALVDFQQVNLLADAPPLREKFDIVFFRNVSIYFDENARRAALAHLREVMNDHACMIVGSAETLSNDLGVLSLIEENGHFHFSKRDRAAASDAALAPALQKPARVKPARALKSNLNADAGVKKAARAMPRIARPETDVGTQAAAGPAATLDEVRELVREKRYNEAMEAVTRLRSPRSSPSRDFSPILLEAYIRLQRREFDTAIAMAHEVLAQDHWSIEAAVLLGFACKWQNDAKEAIHWFERSAYIHYDCWPVHYYLGELYRAVKDPDKAGHAYRRALRQMGAGPDPDGGLLFPLQLPIPEIRFLCNRYGALPGDAGISR